MESHLEMMPIIEIVSMEFDSIYFTVDFRLRFPFFASARWMKIAKRYIIFNQIEMKSTKWPISVR